MKRTVRYILCLSLLAAMSVMSYAESKEDYLNRRSELRVGWGDQLFETLMWRDPSYTITYMPTDQLYGYKENHRYYQHLWIEYQWRFYHWLSFGGMIDGSGVSWDDVTRNGAGVEINRVKDRHFYNLVFMSTVRFTYFHHPNVNLYSGLGVGLDINGGTETNLKGKHTDVGAAVQITVIGVSANYDRWFFTFDLGGLTALKNTNAIYMACSRMLNVGIGARF